jgi:DNA-binding MarR family transcriptional regulator
MGQKREQDRGSNRQMSKMAGERAGQPDISEKLSMDWGLLRNCVGTSVRLLRNELTDRIIDAYSPFMLRSGALSTMVLIKANPGCSQAELAREVAMDDSAMVAIIDELEERGLAVRSRSATDRRRNSLALTPQGETLMDEMIACAMQVEKPIREAMSEEELATLIALLRRAYAAVTDGPP